MHSNSFTTAPPVRLVLSIFEFYDMTTGADRESGFRRTMFGSEIPENRALPVEPAVKVPPNILFDLPLVVVRRRQSHSPDPRKR